jgi:hypothetical protein
MNHSFNTDIAADVGVIPAVLLENIAHWIRRNEANKENFFDECYWTFSSVAAWEDLFPYMTKDQIRRGLEKLEKQGFIKTGNYNKSSYDRTKWYALMPKAWGFYGKSNCQDSQIDLANMPNGKGENAEPIPDITTDITTDITSITSDEVIVTSSSADDPNVHQIKSNQKPSCPHQEIIALYHEILPMCPQVRDWTPARAALLRTRWNEEKKRQNPDYWKRFFEYVSTCDFLVGKSGNRPFLADLPWMLKAENFAKIREGRYENREAA